MLLSGESAENQGAEVEAGAFCHRLVVGGVFPQSGSPYRQESNKEVRRPRVHGDEQEVVSKYNTDFNRTHFPVCSSSEGLILTYQRFDHKREP